MSRFSEWVNKKETDINHKLFKKYFSFQRPSDMLKVEYNTDDKNKNKSGLSDLKNEIKIMGEEEKEIEKPNEVVNVVEKNS